MARTVSLALSASVTLNGSGNGTVQLGPTFPGEAWYPVSVAIGCTGTQPTTLSSVYLYAGNGVSALSQVDTTYDVLGASSSMVSGHRLYPGQVISAVWSNGPPAGTASLTVYGTREVP